MKGSVGKPHVLILVENLPVPLDRRVWQESCALRDAGYVVSVICPKMRGYTASEENLDGIHIHRHWIAGEAGSFFGFLAEYLTALWGETRLAWKLWFRKPFQVIHLCNPPDLLFLVALPFKMLGVKIVYDVHDIWPEMFEVKFGRRGLVYWLIRLAERLTYAIADVVLATNESVKAIAVERGYKKPDRVFVVRSSPDIEPEDVVPDPALKQGKRFLVGYVGVMGNADGVDHLIRAANEVVHQRKREDVQFLLMGTGPEYERLIMLRDRLDLAPYVEMPGRVTDEFLFSALATMDVSISCDPKNPYNDHCTMNKVLEYMAFGKPQVMYDLKEGRASADAASLYVESGSPEGLATAILDLLADADLRSQMGQIGKRRLREHLGWERSVAALRSAYECIVPPQIRADSKGCAKRYNVTGTLLCATSYEQLGTHLLESAKSGNPIVVDFSNTHVITMRRHDPDFRRLTQDIDLFIPDGMPLVWSMNCQSAKLKDRVYGPTFTRYFLQNCPAHYSHYVVGGSLECGDRFRSRMLALNPTLNFVGSSHGRCSLQGETEDEQGLVADLQRLAPDFIWVGLGAPKQYAWINRIKPQLARGVFLAVGFSFDVNAGLKPDAPLWMQRCGLTWLFRLSQEPARLGPRYLKYNLLFCWYLLLDHVIRRRTLKSAE